MKRAKIPADSATAIPISIRRRTSSEARGWRATAAAALKALNPSPTAAPIAPKPMQREAPKMAAILVIVPISISQSLS